MRTPKMFQVPVRGGDLEVAQWSSPPASSAPVIIAAHGITASHVAWQAVADQIGDDVTLLAPDLRGRGASAELPEPYGMAAHAEDLAAVLDWFGTGEVVAAGHSMGAWVVAALAHRVPERVRSVVLIDGGIPLPAPEAADAPAALETALGPALARLHRTFESREAYREFWRSHPAFSEPGAWDERVEAYADYDLVGTEPELRSRVVEAAVRADNLDFVLNPDASAAAVRLRTPVTLLRSPRGLLNEPNPLLPDDLVDKYRPAMAQLEDRLVPDTNHYTILMGAKSAAGVADLLRREAGARTRGVSFYHR